MIFRKLDYFKKKGHVSDEIAAVRLDYHKSKRRTKLFQIENALNGSPENVFMSVGMNMNNVQAMNNFTLKKGKDHPQD
jgi:hypothetical protein